MSQQYIVQVRSINGFYVGDVELSDDELVKILVPKDKVAAAVNLAFASEISLKYLIGKRIVNHNLKKLFNLVNNTLKKNIRAKINYNDEAFNYCINSISNVFEKWRYFYELPENERKIQFTFLKKFTDVVINVAKNEYYYQNNIK